MAKKKIHAASKKRLAPEEGPNGIDRWTSNGYGLILNGKPVTPIAETRVAAKKGIDEIEEVQ